MDQPKKEFSFSFYFLWIIFLVLLDGMVETLYVFLWANQNGGEKIPEYILQESSLLGKLFIVLFLLVNRWMKNRK